METFTENCVKLSFMSIKKYTNKLYCFSPAVMLLTFLFESFAAGWVLFKYKTNEISRLIIYILLALAGFQAAEFMVCGGFGFDGVQWARFGYVSITLLPPLGLHLAHKIAGKKVGAMVKLAYLTCAIFVFYYTFAVSTVEAGVCRANYSVFNTPNLWGELFGAYYYGWLIIGVLFSVRQSKVLYAQKDKSSKIKSRALVWLTIGYVSFMLPTTVVNLIDPNTIEGIPSIMCGFAVILAMILLGFVAPLTLESKKKAQ